MEMEVQGRRKIGMPKRRWLGRGRDDIKEEVYDCATLRHMSSNIDHT